jgi:NADPH-dependent curcumin reductase CurA
MKPPHLTALTRVIGFDDLPNVFDDFLKARIKGRIVVKVAG